MFNQRRDSDLASPAPAHASVEETGMGAALLGELLSANAPLSLGERLIPELNNIHPEAHRHRTLRVVGGADWASKNGLDPDQPLNIGELLERGYVFCNRISNGERPIIGRVGDQDFSRQLFLTREELLYAINHTIPSDLTVEEVRAMAQDTRALSIVYRTGWAADDMIILTKYGVCN